MVPDMTLRIEVCLRTMTNLLIPLIDPRESLAIEQANLVVAHLRVVADQIDRAFHYRLADLKNAVGMAEELAEHASGGKQAVSAARNAKDILERAALLRNLKLPDPAELDELTMALKAAADRLLQASMEDGDAAFRKTAQAIVLKYSDEQITRNRVWTRKTGFDAELDSLPDMQDVVE